MKNIGLYPRVQIDTAGAGVVSHAGAVALVDTVRAAGLDRGLSTALNRWRKPMARHDPGKIVTDLALALAVGGDCLADVAVLRAQPAVFGQVASDPTVSRLVDTLAGDADRALRAIDTARAAARAAVWAAAGEHAPNCQSSSDNPVVIDVDATLITAHSEKEQAAPTFKRGFHPLLTFVDHGAAGTGEPLAGMLRKGNAGSNTAADHIAVLRAAFAKLPGHRPGQRPGRSVLVRAVDNNGDSVPEITYQFTFHTTYQNPDTFLYNTGPIESLTSKNWNRRQFATIKRVQGGKTTTLGTNLPCPPSNIGPSSTPNYPALAKAAIHTLPGGLTVYTGQRAEGFYVDIGAIFDLGTLRPFQNAHLSKMPAAPGINGLLAKNIHSIALQIPKTALTSDGKAPTDKTKAASTIGVYASASRQRSRTYTDDIGTVAHAGPYVQVSRQANPL